LPLTFETNAIERARLDSSGNLLVGTTSASALSAGGRGLIELNGSSDSVYSYKAGSSLVGYMLGSADEVRIASFTAIPLTFYTNNTERARIDSSGNLQFNSGYGSVATAFGCRAWVNFGYVSSAITIRGSGNVSSVTRAGVGNYFVNFSTSMPDANYSAQVNGAVSDGVTGAMFANGANQSASSCQAYSSIGSDVTYCQVAIFR
jgi:hypothetical protein